MRSDATHGSGELLDADVAAEPVFVVRRGGREYVRVGGGEAAAPRALEHPVIRSVPRGLALLVDARADGGRPNAWLMTARGGVEREFFVGEGIADVLVCGGEFVVTYGDEGVFSGVAPGAEGLAGFDQRGEPRWGYHSRFAPHAEPVDDCYCACTDGRSRLWFSAYTRFAVVELRLDSGTQRVTALPRRLHGARALATDGMDFWLHSPYGDDGMILRWSPSTGEIRECGTEPARLRGLFGPRFLTVSLNSHRIIHP